MLQNNSGIPLYQQLSETLEEQIRAGSYPPGAQLPSERKLAASYGISRLTVRRAIQILKQAGFVVVQHGRGIFVSRDLKSPMSRIPLAERGFPLDQATSCEVLDTCVTQTDPGLARQLRLNPYDKIIRIRRIRAVNDQPVALDILNLPYPRCRAILSCDIIATQSLHELLTEHLGIDVRYLRQTLHATLASDFEREILALAPPAPVARFDCTLYDVASCAIGHVIIVYSTEQCMLTFTETVN